MNGPRRICVVTGGRAEYGLLQWVMHEIRAAPDLELQLIVTGVPKAAWKLRAIWSAPILEAE